MRIATFLEWFKITVRCIISSIITQKYHVSIENISFEPFWTIETEIWKDITTGTNTEYTFLVPPQIQTEIKRKFNIANVSYVVEISDLQTAINEENPVTANNNSWFLNSTFGNIKERVDYISLMRELIKLLFYRQ